MPRLLLALALAVAAAGVAAQDHGAHGSTREARAGRMWADTLEKPRQLAVSVAFDRRGRLWLARAQGRHVVVAMSDDLGRTFSEPVRVNPAPEHVAADGENRPKIALAGDGTVHVSYTRSLDRPFSGHIRYSRSTDDGKHFSAPVTVNDHRAVAGHRFDALSVDRHGRVALAWLDQRDRLAAEQQGRKYIGAALYYAVSEDGGASFGANRRLAEHSCECCRIGLDLDRDGVPVAFWRHVYGRNTRDFALARLDGSPPLRASDDGWEIDACPHHGGAIAVDAGGAYHLAWFNNAPGRQGLFYRRTADRGKSFSAPLAFGDNDAQAGHAAVLALAAEVHLAWREFDGKESAVLVMSSPDAGNTWSPPRRVAATAGASDYPLLAAGRGRIYLAWNTAREGLRLFDLARSESRP